MCSKEWVAESCSTGAACWVTSKWWTEHQSILKQVPWFTEVFPNPQLLGLCTQWRFLNAVLNAQQRLLSGSGLCDGQGWIWLWENCSARTGINIHLAAPAHLAFWVAYSVMLKQRGCSSFPKSRAYQPAISIAQTTIQSVVLADTNAFLLWKKEIYPIIYLCNIWQWWFCC